MRDEVDLAAVDEIERPSTDRVPTRADASESWSQRLTVVIVYLMGWALTWTTAYPGWVSGDSADHYYTAEGVWDYTTWHPPLTGMIWSVLLRIWDSPGSVLLFQTGVYWAALFSMSRHIRRRWSIRTDVYWVVISFMPFVFNYVNSLIKDTMSAVFMLVAVALLVGELASERGRVIRLSAAVPLILIGTLVKTPALSMGVVLIAYVAFRASRTALRGRRRSLVVIAAALSFAVLHLGTSALVNTVVDARPAHIEHSLFLFDIAGMSEITGENLLGDQIVPPARASEFINDCADANEWDSLVWGRCSWVAETIYAKDLWNGDYLRTRWLHAIQEHPIAYVEQRLRHIWAFQTSAGKAPTYANYVDSRLPWQPPDGVASRAMSDVTGVLDATPVYRPIFWTFASAGIIALGLRNRRRTSGLPGLAVALGTANLAFYAGLMIIGPAYEFRYSLTVMLFTLVAAALLVVDEIAHRRTPDSESAMSVSSLDAFEESAPEVG